jgi:hypothetical protein
VRTGCQLREVACRLGSSIFKIASSWNPKRNRDAGRTGHCASRSASLSQAGAASLLALSQHSH